MRHDIFTQLAVFRLAAEFKYSGPEDGRGLLSRPVHHWQVLVACRSTSATMADGYTATRNEYLTARGDLLDLTERYFKTLMGRVERIRRLEDRRNFTAWCKSSGVRPDDLRKHAGQQEFWRHRFNEDCRCSREFTEVIGGDDKVETLLSTTIR